MEKKFEFNFTSRDNVSKNLRKISVGIRKVTRPVRRAQNTFKRLAKASGATSKKIKQLNKDVKKLGKGFKEIGDGFKNVGMVGAGASVGVGAATFKFAEFEEQMSKVKSLVGDVTNKEFKQMTSLAKELGATSKFSGQEAAQGYEFLSLAGFKAKESMAVLPTLLNGAAAGSLDLGLAADIVTDSMSTLDVAFDKNASKAQKATKLTDMMALAQARTNTNMEQLGEAIKFGGGSLANLKIPMEQIIGSMGALADSGLKGSMGGTALTNMFNKLLSASSPVKKTMKQLGVDMDNLPLQDVPKLVESLKGALAKIPDENERAGFAMQLFGQRGIRAFHALKTKGSKNLRILSDELKNSKGAAEKMAKVRMNNTMGDLVSLKSAAEGVTVEFGSAFAQAENGGNILKGLVKFTQDLAKSFQLVNEGLEKNSERYKSLSPRQKEMMKFISDFKEGISEGFKVAKEAFNSIKEALAPLIKRFAGADGSVGKLIGKFLVLLMAMTPLIAAVGAIVAAFAIFMPFVSGLMSVLSGLWAAMKIGFIVLKMIGGAFALLASPVLGVVAAIAAVGAALYSVYKYWDQIKSGFGSMMNFIGFGKDKNDPTKQIAANMKKLGNRPDLKPAKFQLKKKIETSGMTESINSLKTENKLVIDINDKAGVAKPQIKKEDKSSSISLGHNRGIAAI